ncbi:MAG TPA: PfkB family carbohydrate kinase [Thermomicrobiaceae bacterium]|nr:PfkB family carbohydrate kinase [Thermomicrobiaceae bacterium]
MTNIVELVRRFQSLRAVVIGDLMLDSYLEGTASRLCTEGPVPVVRRTRVERAPGGAANVAANLRALGSDVTLIGLIGADPAGAMLREALGERDIDTRWLVEDDAASTLHKLRVLADGHYVVRFDEGDTGAISSVSRRRLCSNLVETFAGSDLVIVSDYTYGVIAEDVLTALRALRDTRPVALVVDSKDLRRFHGCRATAVTPNLREARLMLGRRAEPAGVDLPADAEVVGREILRHIDAELAAITLAGDGVALVGRDGTAQHLPSFPIERANDVGAGDTFAATLGLVLAAGGSAPDAASIALEAAAVAVTKPRTAVVEYQELLRRVSLRAFNPLDSDLAGSAERLNAILDTDRLLGRTIVFTNGVFDILHAGHVDFLKRAKALGDVLVVGVNTDAGARRLKGPNRPINNQQDRLALVAALEPVDHAILFDEATPAELIRRLRPRIHVKGGDYADRELPESEAVLEVGGRVVVLPLAGSRSTSDVIERIVTMSTASSGERVGAES